MIRAFLPQALLALPLAVTASLALGQPSAYAAGEDGDETPPEVTIVDPDVLQLIVPEDTWAYKVIVEASDDVGVTEVWMVKDGQVFGEPLTEEPYEFEVSLGEGAHELRAAARDGGGNETLSAFLIVRVGADDSETGDEDSSEETGDEDSSDETTEEGDDDDDDDNDTEEGDDDDDDDDDDTEEGDDDDDDDTEEGDDDDDDDDTEEGDDDDDDDDETDSGSGDTGKTGCSSASPSMTTSLLSVLLLGAWLPRRKTR